ncbi:bidirectional sugar transporter N3 [Jatropha curcas]|uniref:bidirectional sugar transporter N3 n=1 Tax=Jatropha curcas TaxID=180498 RepID=UPI0009D75E8D|nr:bidirectional sugar transporter N3 [Jatropha curcas]
MAMASDHPLIFTFGILGNIISGMMFLAPLPTFIRVYRKKSTEGFHSIPYVVALFSAMLWIYYAILKSTDYLLLSINSSGCLVEIIYIIVYIIYAPKKAKMLTLKLLIVMNIGGFSAILVLTHFFAKGSSRLSIVGWLCVALSAVVFAAPLSIMRLVIRTKSVEFMPFWLSFFLTLSAIMWLLYGVLLKDIYIALPNVIGVLLGTVQMALYAIYKDGKRASSKNSTQNLSETADGTAIIMLNSIQTTNSDDNGVLGNEENQKEPKKPHGEFVESLNQVQPISES